jgi:hypothetical protein
MQRLTTDHHDKIRAHVGGLLGAGVDEAFTDFVTQLASAPEGDSVTLKLACKVKLIGSQLATSVTATAAHTASIKHDIDAAPLELSQMEMEV